MKEEDRLLIDFILDARKPVSAREVLEYLREKIEGFADRQGLDGGVKNTQNRLKKLRESPHFASQISFTLEGKSYLYQGIASTRRPTQEMSIEQACALMMADKHLSAIAPTRLLQSEERYQDLVDQATAAIEKAQQLRMVNKKDIHAFMKRVTVMQRGQRLEAAPLDNGVLACIAECLVLGRCIKLRYNGKDRLLHPFGLVFRQPKVYLLALDTEKLVESGPAKARPRQFLCNRIENANISKEAHQVPKDFDLEDYVNKGRLDLMAFANTVRGRRSFTLKLLIRGDIDDNLVRDLIEFPLSKVQEIEERIDTGDCLLTARGMLPTHTLIDWILGRLDRVEVLEPPAIREYVSDKVRAMYKVYCS